MTGNVSYDPDNHDLMVRLRAQKVAGIAADIPELEVDDPDGARRCSCSAGAGRTARSRAAVRRVRKDGRQGRAGAPPLPEPVPAQHSARCSRRYDRGARPRDEPRPAAEARPRRVPRRRGRLQPVRGLPSVGELAEAMRGDALTPSAARRRSSQSRKCRRARPALRDAGMTARSGERRARQAAADREGLQDPTRRCAGARAAATTRSSPRCRASCPSSASRARRSSSSPGSAARRASRTTWRPTGCTRSTAARRRSRPGLATSRPGPLRLGRDRRRRRALDRRQPPDPRAAPQREPEDPALQQPDLRADEGPVLADERRSGR